MIKRVEKYLSVAIESVEKYIAKDGKVAREFNGYISSFGASVIQSGIKPAVAFFENNNSNAKSARENVPKAILYIIAKKDDSLLKYVLDNDNRNTRDKILDAASALKLAVRTFKFTDGESYE